MQTNSAVHNHVASFNHTYNQSPENQSTQSADSFTLDQSSYAQLIDTLNKLSPFEAIRYAQEINRMNGFEVVGRVEVGRWKRELKKQNLDYEMVNAERLDDMIRPTPHYENENFEIGLKESHLNENLKMKNEKMKYENSGTIYTSVCQYQKAYMILLSQ